MEELDGTHLKAIFAGDRLKHYFSRTELDQDRDSQHEIIQVPDTLKDDEVDLSNLADLEEDLGIVEELVED